jgi:hypothetical protein
MKGLRKTMRNLNQDCRFRTEKWTNTSQIHEAGVLIKWLGLFFSNFISHFRPAMLYKIVTLKLKYSEFILCPLEKLISYNTQRFLWLTVKLVKNAVHHVLIPNDTYTSKRWESFKKQQSPRAVVRNHRRRYLFILGTRKCHKGKTATVNNIHKILS